MYKMIATSRFNNETLSINKEYKNKNNMSGGCIYGCPKMITAKVSLDSFLFIVEMNNETNRIEGIGLIKNMINYEKKHEVYYERNLNRYIYTGNYRINRSEIDPEIIKIFDYILFKEKTHLKRCSGIALIPDKLLNHSYCKNINLQHELKQLFKSHFT